MQSKLTDLTAFQRDCLAVIAERGPLKGLAVKSRIEDLYGGDINHGRLYPNLDQLVEGGLVDKYAVDKRTNNYELTVRGRHALEQHTQWQANCLKGSA